MKHLSIAILSFALLLSAQAAFAQNNLIKSVVQSPATPDNSDDVFIPISKYIAAGNADALSAWFGDNLEIAVLAKESDASRAQARQIVKTFFEDHKPRSFNITHTAGRANMKYALGTLIAGGEAFSVTIFMSCKNDSYKIQQLKIERL